MKKHNMFLSIALLLSAATSQVAFCMQQENGVEIWENPVASSLDQESAPKFTGSDILSEEERTRELEKEARNCYKAHKQLKDFACDQEAKEKRDISLGNLSVLENQVLNKISEFLKLEDLRDLRKCSKILNELVWIHFERTKRNRTLGDLSPVVNDALNHVCEWLELEDLTKVNTTSQILNELVDEHLKTPVSDSNKAISFTIDLNDVSFITKFHEKLKIIQEKMLKFIGNSNRSITINFIPPFGLTRWGGHHYPSITIHKNNINLLETNLLDNVISRKDIAKSEAKKNRKAISVGVALTTGIISLLIADKILSPIAKRNREKLIERLEKGDLRFDWKIDLYISSLILGEKNAKKLQKILATKVLPITQKIGLIPTALALALLSTDYVNRKINHL